MLTSSEILRQMELGHIDIKPFDPKRLNPNSYNLTLGDKLKIYDLDAGQILDPRHPTPTKEIIIDRDRGKVLYPGILYLGTTNEWTRTDRHIACIDGRSSIGRLGIQVHLTAGFGDIGFQGKWTLEINVVHPVLVFPDMEICQIYFEEPTGEIEQTYHGKYFDQQDVMESHMYEDFSKEE